MCASGETAVEGGLANVVHLQGAALVGLQWCARLVVQQGVMYSAASYAAYASSSPEVLLI
eukprot:6458142-Amphidinium_carterae.1